jgi:hypothetical protein
MPPEKNPKDIEGDLHRFLEENGGSTESALPTTEEIVPEVKESFLTHAFGDKPFEFTEQSGQSTAVARKDDGSLSFDKATLDTAEMEMIQEFLEASESPAELAKSKFGWFFAEEDPQFIRQLREHLAKRLALGADGARAELRSANLDDELKTRLDRFIKSCNLRSPDCLSDSF